MCHFISWVEKDNKVYFLTGKQVYETKRGKELQKHSGNIEDDKLGHGAIRYYYRIEGGIDKECTDFSAPDNFPTKIANAIKAGKMRGMSYGIRGLLIAPAEKAYDEAIFTARKAYNEAIAPAWKAYDEAIAPAWKAYDEATSAAEKAYNEARAPAEKAYDEATSAARKAYNEAIGPAFWDLFADVNNRATKWR